MNIHALLDQARDDRGKSVIQLQVDLLKAHGEYNKLGGEVDYKSSLSAIVASHGTTGVKYSLVREVLHDTEQLNAAVTALVEAKEITKSDGKRDFVMKTTKVVANQSKGEQSPPNSSAEKIDDKPVDVPPAVQVTPPAPASDK